MPQDKMNNRRILLASRPHGTPTAENFTLDIQPIPQPAAGQVLLRTRYLSLDPYMRGRMSDAPSYAPRLKWVRSWWGCGFTGRSFKTSRLSSRRLGSGQQRLARLFTL